MTASVSIPSPLMQMRAVVDEAEFLGTEWLEGRVTDQDIRGRCPDLFRHAHRARRDLVIDDHRERIAIKSMSKAAMLLCSSLGDAAFTSGDVRMKYRAIIEGCIALKGVVSRYREKEAA